MTIIQFYTVLDRIEDLAHVRYVSDIIIIYYNSEIVICWSDVVRFIMLLDLIPHIIPFLLEGFTKSF